MYEVPIEKAEICVEVFRRLAKTKNICVVDTTTFNLFNNEEDIVFLIKDVFGWKFSTSTEEFDYQEGAVLKPIQLIYENELMENCEKYITKRYYICTND
jgi:hypothetical protein